MRTGLVILIALAAQACARDARPVRAGAVWRLTCRDAAAASMAVAGDFTVWEPMAVLERHGADWVAKVKLPGPGVYRVQCIADGARRAPPVGLMLTEDDGFGGRNGILFQPGGDPAAVRPLE